MFTRIKTWWRDRRKSKAEKLFEETRREALRDRSKSSGNLTEGDRQRIFRNRPR